MTLRFPNGIVLTGDAEELKDFLPRSCTVQYPAPEALADPASSKASADPASSKVTVSYATGHNKTTCPNDPKTCGKCVCGYCTAYIFMSSPGQFKRCDHADPGLREFVYEDDLELMKRREK